jgi:sterol 3beta-glucosyltransferase
MGKRIALLTYGTRGDIEPFLALAVALGRVGYQPRLAGPRPFQALAAAQGIPFVGLDGDPAAVSAALTDRAGLNPLAMLRFMSAYLYPLAESVLQQAERACLDSDAIIHSFLMTYAGHHLAVEGGIPDLSAQFFPVFSPTAAYPAPVFPDWPLGPAYRRLSHRLVTSAFRRGSEFLYRRLRRSRPSMPNLHRWNVDRQGRIEIPLLLAYSPQLVPPPAELAASARVTGYWVMEEEADWVPDAELAAFLGEGPEPVYVGFGSMSSSKHEHRLRACLDTALQLDLRVVLAPGPGFPLPDALPDSVHRVQDVPHRWLFPRMSAVVHHGGAGTTGGAARAGVPQVVIPFSADQGFWERRAELAGIAPPPIPLRQLSASTFRQALDGALHTADLRARAAFLGEAIRSEHGTEQAIELIRQVIGPP